MLMFSFSQILYLVLIKSSVFISTRHEHTFSCGLLVKRHPPVPPQAGCEISLLKGVESRCGATRLQGVMGLELLTFLQRFYKQQASCETLPYSEGRLSSLSVSMVTSTLPPLGSQSLSYLRYSAG